MSRSTHLVLVLASALVAAAPAAALPCEPAACATLDLDPDSNGYQACDDAEGDGPTPEPLSTYSESQHAHADAVAHPGGIAYVSVGVGAAVWCRGIESEQLELNEHGSVVYAEGFVEHVGGFQVGAEWREQDFYVLGEHRSHGCSIDPMLEVDNPLFGIAPWPRTDPNPAACPAGAGPRVLTALLP